MRATSRKRFESMPKMKPHSGLAKRTRVTSTGKIMTQSANNTHKFVHKSGSQKRRLDSLALAPKAAPKGEKKLRGRWGVPTTIGDWRGTREAGYHRPEDAPPLSEQRRGLPWPALPPVPQGEGADAALHA